MNHLLTPPANKRNTHPAGSTARVQKPLQRSTEPAPAHRTPEIEEALPGNLLEHAPGMLPEEQDREVLPAGVCPEGITIACLPAEALRLLDVALPGQGRAVLTHLLCYATCAPQSTLSPDWAWLSGEEAGEASALVVVHSLKALAQSKDAPCGPDRYYQLMLVLEALQLLKRRVRRSRQAPHSSVTVLSISLTPPASSLSSVLRSCQETAHHYSNPKVKRLLVQASTRLHATLHETAIPQLHQLVSQMERVVTHYQQQGLPQAPLLTLVHQVLSGLLPPDPSVLSTPARKPEMSHQEWQALSPSDQDGFALSPDASQTSKQQPLDPETTRDRFLPPSGKKHSDEGISSCLHVQPPDEPMDHLELALGKKQAHVSKKLHPLSSPVMPEWQTESLPAVNFLPDVGKKQTARVSINDSSFSKKRGLNEESFNDTVITTVSHAATIQEIRHEARRYARLFDGEERWMGKLVNCVKQFPPHILRQAAIETLTRQYHPDALNRPRNPGAWFCRTCERFALHPEQVPEEVRLWAATTLDYEAIIAALAQGQRVPGESSTWWQPSSAPAEGYLDQIEAAQLAQRIQREVDAEYARIQFQAEVQILPEQPDGRWMVLLTWADGVQALFTGEAEWVDYWTGLPEQCASYLQAEGARP